MSGAPQPPFPDQSPYASPQYAAPQPQPQNTMGLVGFIISMCGFACALGYPIGLILSLIGLRSEPKGFAIAGSIIGGLGTLAMLAIVVLYGGMIVACIGMGAAMQPQIQTESAIRDARRDLEAHKKEHGAYPAETEGNDMLAGYSDYWKKPLRYEPQGEGYTVRSAGADGQFDTTDDITKDHTSFDPQLNEFDMDDPMDEDLEMGDEMDLEGEPKELKDELNSDRPVVPEIPSTPAEPIPGEPVKPTEPVAPAEPSLP